MKKFLPIVILSIYALSNLAYAQSAPVKLTSDMFNQIKEGMTYDQVVGIIGQEGELTSEFSTNRRGVRKNYKWVYRNGFDIRIINIGFSDDKVWLKTENGLKQGEEQEANAKVTTTQSQAKTTTKTSPPARSIRPLNQGEFFLCQNQTVQGCKKSGLKTHEHVRFSANGTGLYFIPTQIEKRYTQIIVKFNWTQQGNVARVSNKSSTYSAGLKGDLPTSQSFSATSFELLDDEVLQANTGTVYFRSRLSTIRYGE